MSRLFYHVMQDNSGNLLFDVTGTMRIAGTGTLATIYGDEALTIIISNPMTNHPSFGSFKCFLGAGDYDFYMAKSGYTFETLTGVQGHGTMAQQDASAVAITGGSAQLATLGVSGVATITAQANIGAVTPMAGYQLNTVNSHVAGVSALVGNVGIGIVPGTETLLVNGNARIATTLQVSQRAAIGMTPSANSLSILYAGGAGASGIDCYPVADGGYALYFRSSSGANIGSITTTPSATAYNTSSDRRLKEVVQALTGALDVVRALRPITHLWKADGSRGYGFLADEVQDTLPADAGVVTGERDAVGPQGEIVPQQIDYGKLVPWLTAALNDALGALDTLTARVASLEQQLGV